VRKESPSVRPITNEKESQVNTIEEPALPVAPPKTRKKENPSGNSQRIKLPSELDLGINPFMDLDKLTQEVRERNQALSVNLPPLDNEKLRFIWLDYQNKCDSNIVKANLSLAKAEFADDKNILVAVASKLVMNVLMKEQDLLEEIRREFQRPQLLFSFQEEESLRPEEPSFPTPTKDSEKLAKMIDKNPKVAEMIKKLNLKLID